MKEARFIALNREKWKGMEERRESLDVETVAANFVELSDDLAYARTFYPGSDVERYLNALAGTYQASIHARPLERKPLWRFWTDEYPGLVARHGRTLAFALVFFVSAVGIGFFSAAHDADFVRLILGDHYVNMTIENIEAGKPMGVYNDSDAWTMFISITLNNIKVAFVAFAFGLLFSAGTLWVLFANGVMLGAFQYFFYDYGLLFHSMLSVWAHGTFEITSIAIAGGAGLVMGNAFLFPGTYPRLYSFRRGAADGLKLVAGLVPFFVVAGFIESFVTRYADAFPAVGAVAIVLSAIGVVCYFVVLPYKMKNRESWKR